MQGGAAGTRRAVPECLENLTEDDARMTQEVDVAQGIDILYGGGGAYPPPADLAARANAQADLYQRAAEDYVAYWESEARHLVWFKPWETALDWRPPDARWFVGGKLNVSFNCLDRHVAEGKGAKAAYHWEGEPGDKRTITYGELLEEVLRCGNGPRE